MANIFNRSDYPLNEPFELVIGDTWAWKKDDLAIDYPIGSYSLSYEFHCDSGGGGNHQFTINAVEADSTYYIEVGASTTATYNAHTYKWNAYITRTSDSARSIVDSGIILLTPNYADTNADVRSHAKKVLDALEAVIQGRASIDQSSMSIAGRSLSRMTIDEIMTFRDRYKADYLKEIKKARIKNKTASGNLVKARF